MWSILVITSSIFQTAIAIFLLNGVRTGTDIDKHLRAMLLILLVHLSVKFLLLAVLKDQFLYAQIPTGFSLAYGPLLLVIARSVLGRPMSSRAIVYQLIPFFILSLIYLTMVLAGARGNISRSMISAYVNWYQWLLIPSLYGYPIFVNRMLRQNHSAEGRLAVQISNVLLAGVSAVLLLAILRQMLIAASGFDLRLLPYLFYTAIPVLILRYRLRPPVPAPPGHEDDTTESPIPESPERRYGKSGIDASRLDEYEIALAAFMKKSRIFLDADLSLEDLALKMKMPKHHLTQLLNERVLKNFYTYINEYRIAEAISQIKNHAGDINILSLAFDCGFNSRSSFNNYFKKITGTTPSAYRKKQLEGIDDAGQSLLIPETSPAVS